MKSLAQKWRSLTPKQRLLLAVAILLLVLVVLRYADFSSAALPLPGTIDRRETVLQGKIDYLERLTRRTSERHRRAARLKAKLEPYIWRMGDELPSAEVQSEVDRIARRARATIHTMGSQRVSDAGDSFRSVEVTVNLTGSMREISSLLGAIESAERKFFWRSCRIRPRNAKNVTSISFSGRLQIYFYAAEVERMLFQNGVQ